MILDTLQPIPGNSRHKQPLVIEALTDLARRLGPEAKLPTARELSRALGVTGATLARCLEQLEGRGVLRCLQGSGIYVEAGVMQKRVALVFGENIFSAATSQFGSLLLQYSVARATASNERFSFFLDTPASNGVINGSSVPVHQDLVDAVKDGKIDGIILVARSSVEQEAWLRSQGIPLVTAKARSGAFVEGCFDFDYRKLICLGVENLVKAGCRTVGLFGAMAEHKEMFCAALKSFGLPEKTLWIDAPINDDHSFPAELHEQFGSEMAKRFLVNCGCRTKKSIATADLPEGLVISDDMMALGALPVLARNGIKLGKQLKVASHCNKGSSTLSAWENVITLLPFDPEEMVAALFKDLEAQMNGTAPLNRPANP
ncbi:MAG: substrate-binding domain-containing protein [Chthoniobacteraceae bacterium]